MADNNLWDQISKYAIPEEAQLNEPDAGTGDRYWNCVYATVSVALQCYGYSDTEPEDLRNLIHPGPHHSGGESFDVVANFLRAHPERWPNLPRIDTWNPADTLGTFADMLKKGYLTIFDVYDDQNANVLSAPKAGWGGTHAVILEAMGPTKVTIWNPWRGEKEGQTFDRAYIKGATSGPGGTVTTMVGNLMVFARDLRPTPPIVVSPPVVTPPVVTPPVVIPAHINGIDISSFQGKPDFAAVKNSGMDFVIVKASEGTGFIDSAFNMNWKAIRAAGLVRGAYHFARPDLNTPEAEADWFLSVVGTLEEGDLLALDMEKGDGNLLDWSLRWLRRVHDKVGFKPLLYTGGWFATSHNLTGNAELAAFSLWDSIYQEAVPAPLAGWNKLTMWQHSSTGNVLGISGNVDLNYFFGTKDELIKLGAPAVIPPVVVPPVVTPPVVVNPPVVVEPPVVVPPVVPDLSWWQTLVDFILALIKWHKP